jgi:hypothetical protein
MIFPKESCEDLASVDAPINHDASRRPRRSEGVREDSWIYIGSQPIPFTRIERQTEMRRVSSQQEVGICQQLANFLLAILLTVFPAQSATAQGSCQPLGPVLLTLTGNLGIDSCQGVAVFDEKMLMSLPQHQIETTTPWTEGRIRFEGVLLSDLLRRVGAPNAKMLLATALNDYRVNIPASDASEFGVLLAMRMNGARLSPRDKGPIWVVYPRDSIPRIQDERYDHRWVWQLNRIEVR